jgi:hypothetical protein
VDSQNQNHEVDPLEPASHDEGIPPSWERTPQDQDVALSVGRQKGNYFDQPTPRGHDFQDLMRRAGYSYRGRTGQEEFTYVGLSLAARVPLRVILSEVYGRPIANAKHRIHLDRELKKRARRRISSD